MIRNNDYFTNLFMVKFFYTLNLLLTLFIRDSLIGLQVIEYSH